MYRIITDSSANLPEDWLDRHGVGIVSFHYLLDGVEYRAWAPGQVYDGPAFFGAMRRGASVTTAQVDLQQYLDLCAPILERGEDLIYVSMSAGISGNFQTACMAREALLEQYPDRRMLCFDSKGASLGQGLLVMELAAQKEAGADFDAACAWLEKNQPLLRQRFTVEDLQYLRKGGRLSNAAATVGTVLGIKPLLMGNTQGKIVSYAKVRGRRASIEALYGIFLEEAADGQGTVALAHCDCEPEALELAARLRATGKTRDVLVRCYEPVTGSHLGPGALALFYWADQPLKP